MLRPQLTPWKEPVPIVEESGWASGPVWTGAENLDPTGIRSPDRPARRQSLYGLSYPAQNDCSCNNNSFFFFFSPGATQTIVGVYFTALYRALASSRTRLLDHKQRRATFGRTPLIV